MINLTGKRFGRLIVLGDSGKKDNWGKIFWTCRCSCGNIAKVHSSNLRHGQTKSCGCLRTENCQRMNNSKKYIYKYGENTRTSKLYRIWGAIKSRCYDKGFIYYHNYGGRGIKICEAWKNSYINFRDWATQNGYKNKLTIDRINNDGNYEPSNCQWLTRSENSKKGKD